MELTDVSNGSKNAVGEMIPVRLFTTIAMPVSMNGSLKSTTASRSALIISDDRTMSVLRFTNSATSPFHLPFSSVPHLPSSTRTNSYVKPVPTIQQPQIHITQCNQWLTGSITNMPDGQTYLMVRKISLIDQYKNRCNIDRNCHCDALDPHRCCYWWKMKRKKMFILI